jgi:hypothetical protein
MRSALTRRQAGGGDGAAGRTCCVCRQHESEFNSNKGVYTRGYAGATCTTSAQSVLPPHRAGHAAAAVGGGPGVCRVSVSPAFLSPPNIALPGGVSCKVTAPNETPACSGRAEAPPSGGGTHFAVDDVAAVCKPLALNPSGPDEIALA